ncbi:MAG TPA: FAD-dependent oxidoreductase [Casimicrobiaceae bacterium]|nr:FAD-dependent oxidoreductase [Casimicrobiaceae bacterium]
MSGRASECDVLVIGSGGGGLSAALTASQRGLDVAVVEKTELFGGTTAWSGGWLWIPGNRHAVEGGIVDDVPAARRYLQNELGSRFDAARVDAFLDNGPRMVEFFERETEVKFSPGLRTPDFHPASEGAGVGRGITAVPFDGRELGKLLAKLRPPLPEITVYGMAIAAGTDLQHFMNATRSPGSAWHAGKRFAAHGFHLLRDGRSVHLVNGNALVARLLYSAARRCIPMFNHACAVELLTADGAVTGAVVEIKGKRVRVTTRRGVVLAAGGFPHDVARRRALFPHAPTGREHWSAAPPTNTGDGLRLAEAVGAAIDTELQHPAAWAPVSEVRHPDGRLGIFPHLIDRAKPGVVAVRADGRRFVNEAGSYCDFVAALQQATAEGEEVAAYLLADHPTLRRYGLGYAKPFPFQLAPHLRSGYLKRGATLRELALACGIAPEALERTIADYNRHARSGEDPAFGRGTTPFNRAGGDPKVEPNPCVAAVERAPFYAVKVLPGSLGTFAGVKTDARARALRSDGTPVRGLYAVGSDMASIMAGCYPAGGITLGPAMTFGFIAGEDLAAAGRDGAPAAAVCGIDRTAPEELR